MADENIVTNIVAKADFSDLIADVNRVTASLAKLQKEILASDSKLSTKIATINRSFAEDIRRTGQFSTHFVSLASDVEKFGKNLDGGKLKLRDYFRTFQEHTKTSGGLIRELAKQQVTLQNAIVQPLGKNAQGIQQFNVHIPRGLDETRNKTALARQELQILNKVVQDGGVQLINWGKNTQWAGRQLTVGLTVPLAAFGKAAADAFRMADQELTRLTKVYGGLAQTSASDLKKVRDEVSQTAKELSQSYGTSFKDTIALAADIAATGKQGDELLGSIKETSRLAVLGEVDRQDAMKATLAIQSAFKQNTDELSESINFLNAVENQTSTTLADLVEAIPKAGPVVKGLGGDVKDLALYLTAMREGGVNAAEGANALKSSLASLINPTKVARESFADMGIDLKGIVTSNAGNLTATLLELQRALDTLDPLQKQQALEQLFGKFQFARLNALFSNLGKQGSQTLQVLDLMKASSSDLANIAGRELEMVTESASGKYRRAIESLKADLAGIGESFLKINTTVINVIDGVVDFINKLPDPIKKALTFIGGLTALAGPLIMLTGVLANFFGYIIKGAAHFKALFKGGEGWKMLTPEILAAQQAGSLVEKTFYSDAKAATVLKSALQSLINEFTILQSKAMAGTVPLAPAVESLAGSLVQRATMGREVNPASPYVSARDTRAMSHMNPVGGMTPEERTTQTLFGVVPGAEKVNLRVSNNPQIYAQGDLPNVPGLTRIGGVSTGVVAEEAAKWHAMTGALAMQSESEIALLKKEVATTGLITHELSASYQMLLPEMTRLTSSAASQSAIIVAELQAGKIQVDAAKARIASLNAQIEAQMGQVVSKMAADQGRSVNLQQVPLLSQPIVDASGKSNMKELFRPGRTRDLINRIASSLGVKTFGAGYSTETTRPKRFQTGGPVYLEGGGDDFFKPQGTDTVPAMLTPGEYVVQRQAAQANKPLLDAINSGQSLPAIIEDAVSKYPGQVTSKFEGAHATLGTQLTGQELAATTPLGGRASALAEAFPTQRIFEAKDSNILQIYKELNQAMKAGGAGVTQGQLLQGLRNSMRIGKLFESLPTTNNKVRRTVYKEMLKAIKSHKGKIMDQDFANIYASAIRSSVEKLGPADSIILQKAVQLSSMPENIQINSKEFKNVAKSAGYDLEEMSSESAQSSAKSGKPQFYKSEPSKTGKRGKTAVAIKTDSGFSTSVRSGDSVKNTRAQSLMDKNTALKGIAVKITSAILGSRRTPVVQSAESIALRNKWKRGYASGGPVHMASGGMVPRYYHNGSPGGVQSFQGPIGFGPENSAMTSGHNEFVQQQGPQGFRSNMQAETSKGAFGRGLVQKRPGGGMGIGTQMGIMMGGSMLGQQIGGTTGNAITMASNILPWLPMQKMGGVLKTIISSLSSMTKIAGLAGRAMGLLVRALPGGAAIAGIMLIIKGFQMWRKHVAEVKRENVMLNGITEKGAKEAGINYKNSATAIKDQIAALKLEKESRLASYAATTSSGVGGLTLTIKELKELKKTAKETMPELVGTFNSIDSDQVKDLAANMKAQFIAGGMSAQDATNKIYAIIEASNKMGMGFEAIANSGFTSITDKATAADFIIKNLVNNLKEIDSIDSSAFASNIDTTISSLDGAARALVGTKDETGKVITETDAIIAQFEKLNALGAKNTVLGDKAVENLKKERPELGAILKSTDTIGGMYAKWRILLSGVNIDLKNITSQQAIGIAAYQTALQMAANQSTSQDNTTGALGKANVAAKKLSEEIAKGNKIIKNAGSAEVGYSKQKIKDLQNEIKLIRERAEAKKKALRDAASAENAEAEIQQAQLEYQSALARGDRDAAAAAQLRIGQISRENQLRRAEDKIDANAKKEEAAIQKKLDDDAAKKEKAQDAVAGTGKSVESKTDIYNQIKTIEGRLSQLAIDQVNAKAIDPKKDPEGSKKALEAVKGEFNRIMEALEKSGDKVQEAFTEYVDPKTNKRVAGKTYNFPKQGAVTMGGADSAFSKLVTEVQGGAKENFNKMSSEIRGGASLGDVVRAMGGTVNKGVTLKTEDVTAAIKKNQGSASASLKDMTKDDMSLKDDVRKSIIMVRKLKRGDKFTYDGITYNVSDGYDATFGPNAVRAKKLGGDFAAGQMLKVNDRINSLGVQQEGIVFRPKMSGTVYPNAATMPRYNIPSGQVLGMSGAGANNSYNNNTYSINIELNGTNVNADDIVRRMKAEMALIQAKEGRSKKVGRV